MIDVVVASKHGSTREIADVVAAELRAAGDEARVRDAGNVDGFEGADAVVLGSAIYGRWLKPARTLLEEHRAELSSLPVWLFSSGPLGDPLKPLDPVPDEVAQAAERIGARGHAVFPGKLEMRSLGRGERFVSRALGAEEGDFRDWEEAREWARTIAAQLRVAEPAAAGDTAD